MSYISYPLYTAFHLHNHEPEKQSVSYLYRYAEVSKACNGRFLDVMANIIPVKSMLDEIGEICSGKYHVTSKGHRIMGTLIELHRKEYPAVTAKAAQHPHKREYHSAKN